MISSRNDLLDQHHPYVLAEIHLDFSRGPVYVEYFTHPSVDLPTSIRQYIYSDFNPSGVFPFSQRAGV